MIVEWLLNLLQALLIFLTDPLPVLSTNPFAYFSDLLSNLGALNYFLPISETFMAVVAVIVVFPILMGANIALWVVAQIRGSSSRG